MYYAFGSYCLDTQRYELAQDGVLLPLRPKVFQVLAYLLTHHERVVRKEELLEALWPQQYVGDAALNNYIMEVRKALGDRSPPHHFIRTVRGHGYRFVAPVAVGEAAPVAGPPIVSSAPLAAPALLLPLPPAAAPASGPAPPRPDRPEAERRQLTVLGCQLEGFTALAGQLDPEDLREVFGAYRETCAAVIARFGGQIDTFLGDEALVYFGYPQAHDDDPHRAVRAGLGLVAALAHVNTRQGQTWGVELAVRLGIHTGLVVAGALGEGEPRTLQAIVGEAPTMAARLQELAAPNTVVCSAATARLVAGYFTLEALEPQSLPGVATPVPVYRVVGESASPTRLEVAATRGLTPLVGREPEVALLLERWAAAQDGRGQVVLLSGEAGIGKSRLVQAVTAQLTGEAYTRIAYYCSPYYQQSAFYPVVDHLQRLLQWRTNDSPAEKLHKLEATLRLYGFALQEVVPLLAALLVLPLPERYPPLTLTSERQKQQTLEILLAWLLQEADRQPVCVVVEDLHWADPSTLEWLSLLLAQLPTARVLLLLLFRPEFQPPWAGRSYITPLALSRLSTRQTEEMIGHMAGGMPLPVEVIRQVAATTDGVPLFIEELTKLVLESGLVTKRVGRYELTGSLPQVAIPVTLHDSLIARLDRLGPAKQVAQLGAIVGREFAYEVLQAVAPLEEGVLQQGLAQLVAAELLYQRGLPPQARYRFKHALIQEAAYQSVLKRTRQQSHQQIAQVLAERFPETVETQPELLAHHYTEAGHAAQAMPYWQRAGQQALQRSANLEAIGHLTKGLELLQTLPETVERRQQELSLYVALSVALILTRGYTAPEVEATCARARALCQESGDTPHVFFPVYGLFRFYILRGHLHTARELADQLVRLAQQAPDTAMPSVAYSALAGVAFHGGEFATAHALLEQSLALFNPDQQTAVIAQYGDDPGIICLSLGAWVQWMLGYPDRACQQSQEALAVARQLAHPFSQVFALTFAAVLHQFRREARRTQEQADAAIRLSTEQGFPWWLAWGTIMRGWALAEQGRYAAGLAQLRLGLAAYQTTGANLLWPYFLGVQAEAQGKGGELTAGLLGVEDALALASTAGQQPWYEAEIYRRKGELLLAQANARHREEDAAACFLRALGIARRQQAKSLELRAATSLARLWQRQGKRADAHRLLVEVYDWFTEGFATADLEEAKVLLEDSGLKLYERFIQCAMLSRTRE